MSYDYDTVQRILEEFSKQLGLDKLNPQLNRLIELKDNYQISFFKTVELRDYEKKPSEVLIEELKELTEDILSSPIVKGKLNRRDKKIETLEKKVEELEKYETHYNLEGKLRHGKEV